MRAWRSIMARRSVGLSRSSRMIARAWAASFDPLEDDRPQRAMDGLDRRLSFGRARPNAARKSSASASDVPTATSSFEE